MVAKERSDSIRRRLIFSQSLLIGLMKSNHLFQ